MTHLPVHLHINPSCTSAKGCRLLTLHKEQATAESTSSEGRDRHIRQSRFRPSPVCLASPTTVLATRLLPYNRYAQQFSSSARRGQVPASDLSGVQPTPSLCCPCAQTSCAPASLHLCLYCPCAFCPQAVEARRSERLWRERVDAFSQALDKQKEDTLDITADMLRQYKAMQVRSTVGMHPLRIQSSLASQASRALESNSQGQAATETHSTCACRHRAAQM